MTTEQPTVTIYALVDPRTDEIRYIGQTRGRPAVRLAKHLREAHLARASALKVAWLDDLAHAGLAPAIRILALTTMEHATAEERRQITVALRQGHTLVNIIHTPNRPCPAKAGSAMALAHHNPARRLPFHRYFRLEPDGHIVALDTPEPVRNRRVRSDGVMEVRLGTGPWARHSMEMVRDEPASR